MRIPTLGRRPRSGIRLVLLTLILSLGPAAQAEIFELPEDGEILRYQRVLGEFEHEDPGPEVILQADGRLQVRRPVYMKNPGLWQIRLEKAEMMTLLRDVVESGFVDADASTLRAQRAGIEKRRRQAAKSAGVQPVLYATGGPDTSVLSLRLASYRPAGDLAAVKSGPVRRSLQWSNLPVDADRFPEIRELVAFRKLELRMIQFIDMESLEKVSADAATEAATSEIPVSSRVHVHAREVKP